MFYGTWEIGKRNYEVFFASSNLFQIPAIFSEGVTPVRFFDDCKLNFKTYCFFCFFCFFFFGNVILIFGSMEAEVKFSL